jgi:hypothetical protein
MVHSWALRTFQPGLSGTVNENTMVLCAWYHDARVPAALSRGTMMSLALSLGTLQLGELEQLGVRPTTLRA